MAEAPERQPVGRSMYSLAVAIPGTPVAWKRPSSGRRAHTSRHDAYLAWREQVGWITDDERRRQRLPKPVFAAFECCVELEFVGAPATADTDNLAKAVLDGLQGVAYANDRQVTTLHVRRHPQSFGSRGLLLTILGPATPMLPDDAVNDLADAVQRYGVPATDRRTA